jgi:two-component system cell cycle response regulator CpdR
MSVGNVKKLRILVVDDEQVVRECLLMLLSYDGHEVKIAGSGEEGLALFEPGKFDVVFTDYMMPGMNGGALVEAIKARAPGQPVVMVTAQAEQLKRLGCLPRGVDFLIDKPFGLADVREAIVQLTTEKVLAA